MKKPFWEKPVEGETNIWLTPPSLIQSLGHFHLDPCFGEPRPWSTAEHHFGPEQDGLSREWFGRVWLNPPYGKETAKWLKKMSIHGYGIALVYARVDTAWWNDLVVPFACGVLFVRRRIQFCKPDGSLYLKATQPSALIAYSEYDLQWLNYVHKHKIIEGNLWIPLK
jgi:hypothetical protein